MIGFKEMLSQLLLFIYKWRFFAAVIFSRNNANKIGTQNHTHIPYFYVIFHTQWFWILFLYILFKDTLFATKN